MLKVSSFVLYGVFLTCVYVDVDVCLSLYSLTCGDVEVCVCVSMRAPVCWWW